MGPGGRAFVVSFLAFLVFGAIVVALRPGDDSAAQESTGGGGGGASGTPGESADEFADENENATASNLTESDAAGADAGAAGDGAAQAG